MTYRFFSLLLYGLTLASMSAHALPPTSRTVYKCEVDGKVTYSDDPCLGAHKLEVEPTRGLDRSSGRKRVGADISREYFNEGLAQALHPITGMDPKQWETHKRRTKLTPESQRECRVLDVRIPEVERNEAQADPSARPQTQKQLYQLRVRARALGC